LVKYLNGLSNLQEKTKVSVFASHRGSGSFQKSLCADQQGSVLSFMYFSEKKKKIRGAAQVVDRPPSKLEVLNSNPNIAKKEKRNNFKRSFNTIFYILPFFLIVLVVSFLSASGGSFCFYWQRVVYGLDVSSYY
jgi:hypothetical protein